MLFLKKILVVLTTISLMLFVFASLTGCNRVTVVDAEKILSQIPDDNRLILVPTEIASFNNEKFTTISFDDIALMQEKEGHTYNEEELFEKVRSLGVQYILISSDMTNKTNIQFPWMTNKNFRVCPGNVDHASERYYTLLIWDNSKNTYHFFKFLYEDHK